MLLLSGHPSIADEQFKAAADVANELLKNNLSCGSSLPHWGPSYAGPGDSARYTLQPTPQHITITCTTTDGILIVLAGRSIMAAHALAGAG